MNTLMKKSVFLCALFLFVMSSTTPGMCTEDEDFGQPISPSAEEPSGFNPARWLLSIYRDHISPVNGDGCPSFPSCSSYAEQAFKKHGFFMGWLMTVDRLIHEGEEETSVSPYIHTDGEVLIFDPVENNDFWWYSPDESHHE